MKVYMLFMVAVLTAWALNGAIMWLGGSSKYATVLASIALLEAIRAGRS